jgi:hypothetical protein
MRDMSDTNSSNWQQDLIDRALQLERRLQNAQTYIGQNQNVNSEYKIALDKVAELQEAISRFAGTFNKEYAAK